MKTSLTLAGACFVVDLDLETDAVAGNEDEDDMDVDPRTEGGGQEREGRGKVRLSKIIASHARGEHQGKSEWIAKVLKDRVERYLSVWNERDREWEGQVRLERSIRGLEDELKDLKDLDRIAESAPEDLDWFAEIEQVSSKIAELVISSYVLAV